MDSCLTRHRAVQAGLSLPACLPGYLRWHCFFGVADKRSIVMSVARVHACVCACLCRRGGQDAKRAAAALANMGTNHDVFTLKGGFRAWQVRRAPAMHMCGLLEALRACMRACVSEVA